MPSYGKDNEIVTLVRKLGSRKKVDVDSAKARLTIIGARAVENLIEALDLENNEVKCNAISILALIRDLRAKDPLVAMLLERNPKVRSAAARALSNFSSRGVIRSLERLIKYEKNADVKLSAVHSLIDIFKNGDDGSLGVILETLFKKNERREVRIASLSILPYLKPRERKALIKKLKSDQEKEVRERATEFETIGNQPDRSEDEIKRSIHLLASPEYEEFNRAIRHLISSGPKTIDPLISEMLLRGNDAEFCSRASMVLKGLEPSSLKLIIPHLDKINDSLPLKILVDVIGSKGEKALLYSLKGLIDRMYEKQEFAEDRETRNQFRQIRARAHLQLAKAGSRLAVDDLKRSILENAASVDLDLLSSFEYIGKKDELPFLFKAYSRENGWTREKIKNVLFKIMKREKIRKNNRICKTFEREDPLTFKELFQ